MFIEHFLCDRHDGKEKMNKAIYANSPFGNIHMTIIVKQFNRDCNRGLYKVLLEQGEVRCIFGRFPRNSHWSRGIVASHVHISRGKMIPNLLQRSYCKSRGGSWWWFYSWMCLWLGSNNRKRNLLLAVAELDLWEY